MSLFIDVSELDVFEILERIFPGKWVVELDEETGSSYLSGVWEGKDISWTPNSYDSDVDAAKAILAEHFGENALFEDSLKAEIESVDNGITYFVGDEGELTGDEDLEGEIVAYFNGERLYFNGEENFEDPMFAYLEVYLAQRDNIDKQIMSLSVK